jgi:hypothetical protein
MVQMVIRHRRSRSFLCLVRTMKRESQERQSRLVRIWTPDMTNITPSIYQISPTLLHSGDQSWTIGHLQSQAPSKTWRRSSPLLVHLCNELCVDRPSTTALRSFSQDKVLNGLVWDGSCMASLMSLPRASPGAAAVLKAWAASSIWRKSCSAQK